jgi:hypothetical protein
MGPTDHTVLASQARAVPREERAVPRDPRAAPRDPRADHMMVAMDIPTTIQYLENQASPSHPRVHPPRDPRAHTIHTMVAIIKSSPPTTMLFCFSI